MSWSLRFVPLKLCVGFSMFDSLSLLLKFIFFFKKIDGRFDFKNVILFQNNRKAKHSFAARPLIFKLQQEVLKFNDICVSWSLPKTDLVIKKIFNLEDRSFENVRFSQ